MSCSVNPTAWGESNRVQLATGKVQRWVLARTTRDRPSLSTVADTTKAVMTKWFAGSPLDTLFADAGDTVDAITLHAVMDAPPVPGSGDQRREALDPVPLLASSPTPPVYVDVSFNYRGVWKNMPWPVWTQVSTSLLRSDKLCPFDCDWMLVSAQNLATLPDVGTESTWLEKLSTNAPGPVAGLAQLVQLATWGLVAYGAVQVFGVARALTPRRGRARS